MLLKDNNFHHSYLFLKPSKCQPQEGGQAVVHNEQQPQLHQAQNSTLSPQAAVGHQHKDNHQGAAAATGLSPHQNQNHTAGVGQGHGTTVGAGPTGGGMYKGAPLPPFAAGAVMADPVFQFGMTDEEGITEMWLSEES